MKSITKGENIIKEIKRLKSKQWWKGLDPPRIYILHFKRHFSATPPCLARRNYTANILKKLKYSRIPTPYLKFVKFVNGDGS